MKEEYHFQTMGNLHEEISAVTACQKNKIEKKRRKRVFRARPEYHQQKCSY